MTIIIGTPYHPSGAYIFDRYLDNQKQIQENYPDCELILSTSRKEYADEINEKLKKWGLKSQVIVHEVVKPAHARDRIWDITAARNAIRSYALSQSAMHGLLFLDSDMIYDPAVIRILETQKRGCEVIYSGYSLKDNWLAMSGFGCVLLSRKTLESIQFRCVEFKKGDVLCEDEMLEFDLNRKGYRVRKGIFLNIDHYRSPSEKFSIRPQRAPLVNRFFNQKYLRYVLIRLSLATQVDISARSKRVIQKYIHPKIKT
jgi:hypothetical protein